MTCREARAILAIAPPPATATKLTRPQIRTALKRSGRRNHVQAWTEKIHAGLRAEHLRQPALVEDAFGHQALALPAVVDATCASAAALEEAATAAFRAHPDYEIITSFPGLGDLTGARLLGEVGDDRVRFTDARALKAYARAAPITRADGRSHTVVHRRVKNQRLAAVGHAWASAALTASPGARKHYDRRKDHGDRHAAALRNLCNRFLGCLFWCLTTRQTYQEHAAFPTSTRQPSAA